MHDFESAAWAEHHGQLSAAVHKLVQDTAAAFDRLQHIQFDAPWNRPARRKAVR